MQTLSPQSECSDAVILNKKQIADIMPHQDPFLFLDEAKIMTTKAKGSYRIRGDEYFLKGHFREEPIFPASIMIEAVGQLAVLFLLTSRGLGLPRPVNNKKIMFTASKESSCHKICKPGDILDFEVILKKVRPPFIKFENCLVSREGEKVFRNREITLAFSFKD